MWRSWLTAVSLLGKCRHWSLIQNVPCLNSDMENVGFATIDPVVASQWYSGNTCLPHVVNDLEFAFLKMVVLPFRSMRSAWMSTFFVMLGCKDGKVLFWCATSSTLQITFWLSLFGAEFFSQVQFFEEMLDLIFEEVEREGAISTTICLANLGLGHAQSRWSLELFTWKVKVP